MSNNKKISNVSDVDVNVEDEHTDENELVKGSNTFVNNTNGNIVDELTELLSKLDNVDLSNMDTEKILELRKRNNPYGRTIAGANKFLNFSITQITHEYWKKFITTAMVAYLNRMCDEWKVPEGLPVVSVYEYLDDKSKLDPPEIIVKKNNKRILEEYEFNKKWMEKRIVVKEFLEEMFQFNPDEHVRSAYRPNYKDNSRPILETMAAKLAVKHLCKKESEFKAQKEIHDKISSTDMTNTNTQPPKTKKVKRQIKSKDGTIKTVIREVPVEKEVSVEKNVSNQNITNQKEVSLPKSTNSQPEPLDKTNPKDNTLINTVTNIIPPHDIFERFKFYYTTNYEELRDAVNALYCEKPEFELAINPYAVHDTAEQAESFKKQHANEVIAEVFTVETGKWNFFDSFKKQRENVNFYNKNTIILEEMIKQLERDQRLGQDITNKRVTKKKAENVLESGPDAENFKKWTEENNNLTKLGAKHIGDTTSDDLADDEIEVPVWRIAKGGLEITKDRIITRAEAPTFMQEANDKVKLEGVFTPLNPDDKV